MVRMAARWAGVAFALSVVAVAPVVAEARPDEGGSAEAPRDVPLEWAARLRGISIAAGLRVGSGVVVLVDAKGGVLALDGATGKTRWQAKAPKRPTPEDPTRVALQDGVAVVAWPGANALEGLALDSGERVWTRPLGANVTGLAACGNQAAVVVSHRAAGDGTDLLPVAHAVEPSTGQTLWMEKAVGPIVAGLKGWVFAQDRRLGSDYRMVAHVCDSGAPHLMKVEPGTVWRVFDIDGTAALVEVSYNNNTVFDACALELASAGGEREEPRCRDLAHLAPQDHRMCGAIGRGDVAWLALAPPSSSPGGGQVIAWHWRRHKKLALTAPGAGNQALMRQGRWVATAWASGQKKVPSMLRFLDADTLTTTVQASLAHAPEDLTADGERVYALLADGSVVAASWPDGSASAPAPAGARVEPRTSSLRLITDPFPE